MSTIEGVAVSELVNFFREELELCQVKPGENVLVFTEPSYKWPHYPPAIMNAARGLGANAYLLIAPSTEKDIDNPVVAAAWKQANMVIGCSQIPWLYSETHNLITAGGTRTLMVIGDYDYLRRLFPNKDVSRRAYAGARLMAEAKEIRVTDKYGSDFTMRKDGRKGHLQDGISQRPGRWDNMGGGFVACAPLEDSTEGIYMVHPGDILLHFNRHVVTAPIKLTFEGGRIISIDGGWEADMLRGRFESYNDPDGWRVAHAGWGVHDKADWNHAFAMDSESLYGNVMVSIGRNIFDSPDEFSGFGGKNNTRLHFDICCRHKNLFLDGELIVNEQEEIIPIDLR